MSEAETGASGLGSAGSFVPVAAENRPKAFGSLKRDRANPAPSVAPPFRDRLRLPSAANDEDALTNRLATCRTWRKGAVSCAPTWADDRALRSKDAPAAQPTLADRPRRRTLHWRHFRLSPRPRLLDDPARAHRLVGRRGARPTVPAQTGRALGKSPSALEGRSIRRLRFAVTDRPSSPPLF